MSAICSVLLEPDIRKRVEHILGIESVAADAMSRIDSSGDYSLRLDIYDHATRILQVRPTIDLFADNKNNKCGRFVAWNRRNGEGAERTTHSICRRGLQQTSPTSSRQCSYSAKFYRG
jgi:hypothetical protein